MKENVDKFEIKSKLIDLLIDGNITKKEFMFLYEKASLSIKDKYLTPLRADGGWLCGIEHDPKTGDFIWDKPKRP
jgi:hypothetical protein